jgi:hypothetical protein
MVNTLVLSVFERTRWLGMLRAVAMTRRQGRRMIRQEKVITALIGAALGLPLGVVLAALVTQAMSTCAIGLSVAWSTLGAFALVAVPDGIASPHGRRGRTRARLAAASDRFWPPVTPSPERAAPGVWSARRRWSSGFSVRSRCAAMVTWSRWVGPSRAR